jgi:uncharacterized protein
LTPEKPGRHRLLEIGGTAALLLAIGAVVTGYLYYQDLCRQLAAALERRDLPAARRLVQRGADVDTRTRSGDTLLRAACMERDAALAMELLDRGADPNIGSQVWRPLTSAARWGNAPVVERLLACGAAVNHADPDGATALMHAAGSGRVAAIRHLLRRRADPHTRDRVRRTALHWAALLWQGYADGAHEAWMGELHERGDDPNRAGVLLAAGPEVDARDQWNRTPLWYASYLGHTRTARILLARGAQVDTPDQQGITPLMAAAGPNHSPAEPAEVVELLLSRGANVHARSRPGKTALALARESEQWQVARRLVRAGAH